MQEAQVYSHDGPIRCRKRGYILTTDQSDARSAGIFSRRTNHYLLPPAEEVVVHRSGRGALARALLLQRRNVRETRTAAAARGREAGKCLQAGANQQPHSFKRREAVRRHRGDSTKSSVQNRALVKRQGRTTCVRLGASPSVTEASTPSEYPPLVLQSHTGVTSL